MRTSLVFCDTDEKLRAIASALAEDCPHLFVLPEGLFRLEEPDEHRKEWQAWGYEVLKPDERFRLIPCANGVLGDAHTALQNHLARFQKVYIATDPDRVGQVRGEDPLRFFRYSGPMYRVILHALDPASIREAFANAGPIADYANIYTAYDTFRQAHHIYNRSLTRAATRALKPTDWQGTFPISFNKTLALGLICQRETERLSFKSTPESLVRVTVSNGPTLTDFVLDVPDEVQAHKLAEHIVGCKGQVLIWNTRNRHPPPFVTSITVLQCLAAARYGWSTQYTHELARILYERHKVITFPFTRSRHLPNSWQEKTYALARALGPLFEVTEEPIIRSGEDQLYIGPAMQGECGYGCIPNPAIADFSEALKNLHEDERKLFNLIAGVFLSAVNHDEIFTRRETRVPISLNGQEKHLMRVDFVDVQPGWSSVFLDATGIGAFKSEAPAIFSGGESVEVLSAKVYTRPKAAPSRYTEGTINRFSADSWRFISDPELQEETALNEDVNGSAVTSGFLKLRALNYFDVTDEGIVPSKRAMTAYAILKEHVPSVLSFDTLTKLERNLDRLVRDEEGVTPASIIDDLSLTIFDLIEQMKVASAPDEIGMAPTEGMLSAAAIKAERAGIPIPPDAMASYIHCRAFLAHAPDGEGPFPPTESQLNYAEMLAATTGQIVPTVALQDRESMKEWLDMVSGR